MLNDRGSFQAVLQITDEVMVGMIVAPLGYWAGRSSGSTLASVNSARYADMGRAPTFSDTRVQVRAIGSRRGGLHAARRVGRLYRGRLTAFRLLMERIVSHSEVTFESEVLFAHRATVS